MPYHSYDRSRPSECIFFDPQKKQIEKRGSEGNYSQFTGLSIEVQYDTIRQINGRPSSSYDILDVDRSISFPYRLDTLLADTMSLTIHLATDKREYSYGITVKKTDWKNAPMPFTLYYTSSQSKYLPKKKK